MGVMGRDWWTHTPVPSPLAGNKPAPHSRSADCWITHSVSFASSYLLTSNAVSWVISQNNDLHQLLVSGSVWGDLERRQKQSRNVNLCLVDPKMMSFQCATLKGLPGVSARYLVPSTFVFLTDCPLSPMVRSSFQSLPPDFLGLLGDHTLSWDRGKPSPP